MEEKIGVIKEALKEAMQADDKDREQALSAFLETYKEDGRASVLSLCERAQKKQNELQKEKERMRIMFSFERQHPDCDLICGIDEVGRGPLAGPVVAGAVILPKDCGLLYLNDSKKLTEKKREELYDKIRGEAVAYQTAFVDPDRIDEINILQATYEAMRRAVAALSPQPELLLNDAVSIPGISIPQVPIIKGDAKSASIAAASIIAKVERDRYMVRMEEIYPGYGFASNKGYGSEAHIRALKELGPCKIHRRSFIGHFI